MEAKLIEFMGDDLRVVNAARVSFHKESDWEIPEGVKKASENGSHPMGLEGIHWEKELSDKDQKLIKYLATHNHWTPFSHVMITMREKVPIFVARQRFKHMVGFTYNEVSRRYVDDDPEFYVPDQWRKKAENKKQGSSDEVIEYLIYPNEEIDIYEGVMEPKEILVPIKEEYKYFIDYVENFYKQMIASGVAPEQARMILPQSMYTEYVVTGSLSAWARAWKLRSDEHSQLEIRELANQWDKIISSLPELKHSWIALKQ